MAIFSKVSTNIIFNIRVSFYPKIVNLFTLHSQTSQAMYIITVLNHIYLSNNTTHWFNISKLVNQVQFIYWVYQYHLTYRSSCKPVNILVVVSVFYYSSSNEHILTWFSFMYHSILACFSKRTTIFIKQDKITSLYISITTKPFWFIHKF